MKPTSHAGDIEAQIHPELVARMNRADRARNGVSREISPESVDFDAVLEAVASEGAPVLPPEGPVPDETGPRDRNLSEVIDRIRDEGPAGELADDILELGPSAAGKRPPDAEKPHAPQRPVPPKPEQQAPETKTSAEPPAAPRSPLVVRLLLAVLGLAVAALTAYGWHLNERQADLEAELKAAHLMIDLLDERSREQGRRLTALAETDRTPAVTPAALEQALAEERTFLLGELSLLAAALPAQASPPAPQDPPVKATRPEPVPVEPERGKKAKPAGRWQVHLASYDSKRKAEQARARVAGQMEQPLEIQAARYKGRPIWRLTVSGLPNRKVALALRARARQALGFKGAWVARKR